MKKIKIFRIFKKKKKKKAKLHRMATKEARIRHKAKTHAESL